MKKRKKKVKKTNKKVKKAEFTFSCIKKNINQLFRLDTLEDVL